MTTPTNPARAGWYDDPDRPGQLRYFDGILWTQHVSEPAPRRVDAPAQESGVEATGPSAAAGQEVAPTSTTGWDDGDPSRGRRRSPGSPSSPGEVIPGVTSADGARYASYGARVGAFFLDGLIKVVLNVLFGGWAFYLALRHQIDAYLAAAGRGETPPPLDVTQAKLGWLTVYVVIVATIGLIYSTTFLARRGATPGKIAVGIRVRDVATGDRLTVTAAAKRYLISYATTLSSPLGVLGSVMVGLWCLDHLLPLFDANRQALHDKLAGSEVVTDRG
ncbi:MAG: RDD family protein [Nostocoides sp.]